MWVPHSGKIAVSAKKLSVTQPQIFAVVSLFIIVSVGVVTSVTQSSFYREAIIKRDAAIITDMVEAMILEQESEGELTASDLKNYERPDSQARLAHSFGMLTNIFGEARIKVFNQDGRIAWSDHSGLIGDAFTRNPNDLARAMQGEQRAVFVPVQSVGRPEEGLPNTDLIEFYAPFSLDAARQSGAVTGVVALYRSPAELNETITKSLVLLWMVTGIGGAILFFALYKLFERVYFGKRQAESEFAKLSTEHVRIMQIEKLSAMGQLVSEIAHQLNNPLVGVLNLAQLAEREIENPDRVKELLSEVRRAGSQCRDFVQRMLVINKVARSEPQTTDLVILTKDTIAFFQQSLGSRPAIHFTSTVQKMPLSVDPVLVRNALFNLIHNAALADPDGVVDVYLERTDLNRPGCQIVIVDHGPGIPADVAAKLFTPFFTTRAGGTGLGLSIAQHITIQHGGTIAAANNPEGKGARFTMWLPAARQTDEVKNSPAR